MSVVALVIAPSIALDFPSADEVISAPADESTSQVIEYEEMNQVNSNAYQVTQ